MSCEPVARIGGAEGGGVRAWPGLRVVVRGLLLLLSESLYLYLLSLFMEACMLLRVLAVVGVDAREDDEDEDRMRLGA